MHRVPVLALHPQQQRVARDAGVVDQDVDPARAAPACRPRRRRSPAASVTSSADRFGRAAGRRESRRPSLWRSRHGRPRRPCAPAAASRSRDRPADAARRARDQGHPARKVRHRQPCLLQHTPRRRRNLARARLRPTSVSASASRATMRCSASRAAVAMPFSTACAVRPAVADHGHAVQAEQRRAAGFRVVHALLEPRERPAREQRRRSATRSSAPSSSRSISSAASTRPSPTLSAMLPVNPSQTITSARPLKNSRASRLPRKSIGRPLEQGVRFANRGRCPCRPPRRSTAGRPWGARPPSARRAYAAPSTPNWQRCSGRQSRLAPASSRIAAPARVGTVTASAGRSTPGSDAERRCAARNVAPVCPALKSAVGLAARDETGGDANRRPGLAAVRRQRRLVHADRIGRVDDRDERIDVRRPAARSVAGGSSTGPVSVDRHAAVRAACSAPATTAPGAWSPPIASTATVIMGLGTSGAG